jgi:hypothetical protein
VARDFAERKATLVQGVKQAIHGIIVEMPDTQETVIEQEVESISFKRTIRDSGYLGSDVEVYEDGENGF